MADNHPIAIVGIGCLFPQANNLQQYWRLLYHGRDAITDVPPTHWNRDDYYNQDPKAPDQVYCTRGGFLSPVAFDPSEFGIPPSTLEAIDSSQLLALVAAKMALEDAGYDTGNRHLHERVSVILGVTGTQELVIPLSSRLSHPLWRQALLQSGIEAAKASEVVDKISDQYVAWQENSFPGLLGNVVAGRIANRLNFTGTNCVVDAACASCK
jgi:acyl transferase domain-containing protein